MTKILVIEDGDDTRADVVEMLKLEGYEAQGAVNGREGIRIASDFQPDLILCDIMMPELDGYEVLSRIRSDPQLATIPFIFITAKTERIHMRSGMVLGADDYITKPFRIEELLDSVRSQLDKRAELNRYADLKLAELRENIITSLPHELRTPLNTIIGFSDMLLMEAQRLKPDQVADWATHISAAARRLYNLIEDYLYYARVHTLAQEDAPLPEVRDALVTDAQFIIEDQVRRVVTHHQRNDDLVLNLDPAAPLHIQHHDLAKIVEELVDNACKFSQAGRPVRVAGTDTTTAYKISIIDEGEGLPPEKIASIGAYMQFDRWLQEQQGMGFGLAIVQRIIQIYSGDLRIHSDDTGTRMDVFLPHRPS